MNRTVKVKLKWTSKKEGGKKHVFPRGMRYCPIAVVEGGENHESLWSSSVINTNINGRKTEAELSFLADDAPHNLLITGKKVLLYEGQSVVAEGKIL